MNARADGPPTAAQVAAARDLFIAAEKDEDAQRWADALDKLERVAAVKRTSGVRYHTALCEEHLGRLRAAFEDYKAAAAQARDENASDVLRLVDRRLADAADRLPRLVVVLVPDVPDATILVDGEPVLSGATVMVDPGDHKIEVSATGRVPAERTVTVVERNATSVEVPLAVITPQEATAPAPPPVTAPPPASPPRTSRDRTVAIAGTAVAVALVGGGVAAFVVASAKHSAGVTDCAQVVSASSSACDPQRNAVRTWDWVAVGAWTGAAAAAVVATVALVRLGHDGERATTVGLGPGSVELRGVF